MKETHTLKGLQSFLARAESEMEVLKSELNAKILELKQKEKHIKKIKADIDSLKTNSETIVSEHAILRYLERIHGMDLANIQNLILSDEIKKQIAVLGGNGTFPANGFRVVVKNNTIVTVTVE